MAGTFRLSVGGQEAGDIRWDAAHGKVLAELHALDVVARAAMLGAADGAPRPRSTCRTARRPTPWPSGRVPAAVAPATPRCRTPRTRATAHAPRPGRDLLPAHQGPAPLRAGQPDAGPRPPQRRARRVTVWLDALRAADLFRGDVQLHRVHQYDLNARRRRRTCRASGPHRVDDAPPPRCRAVWPATTVWQRRRRQPGCGGLDFSRVVYLHPGGHGRSRDAADGPARR